MTILAVEKNRESLQQLASLVSELQPEAKLLCFENSLEALAAAREKEIDLALLTVSMPELGGLDLGQYLTELYPLVNLVFLADDRDKGYEALAMHASGYLLRPAEKQGLKRELEDLRHPAVQRNERRVFAQTFGNFELFVDGKPVMFKYTRTKEIVAMLVNNCGAQTTNGEIIANLWEDDGDPEKKSSYLSNLRQDLQNTFTKLKLNGIILKQRGSMAIAKDRIECDLYDWLEKKQKSRYHYLGDYMNQYSWPEYRHAELDEISYAMEDEA
ncbi:MAG: response regulator [Oscillospiraceae bacterium]|nr:response regulator [Oscillospiraceae bacterium]